MTWYFKYKFVFQIINKNIYVCKSQIEHPTVENEKYQSDIVDRFNWEFLNPQLTDPSNECQLCSKVNQEKEVKCNFICQYFDSKLIMVHAKA